MSFDPFDDCLYSETMKDLKTSLTENHTGPIGTDDTGDHFPLPDELHASDKPGYEEPESVDGDPFVEKLNQVISIMGDLQEMISSSTEADPRLVAAFQKYLKGFTHYCNELKDELTNIENHE